MDNRKPFWASRTLWVNLVALAGSIATAFGMGMGAEEQTAIIGGIMAAVNIALRFNTDRGLK